MDGRSDIFSLGVMMYQLMTGQLPFYADNPAALMHKIMNEPNPDPRKLNPGIVKPVVTVLNNALTKDRQKRYQKASLMCTHLRQIGERMDVLKARKKKKSDA